MVNSRILFPLALLAAGAVVSGPDIAYGANTRVTNPSSVGVEILGRSLGYSVFLDRVLSDQFSAGLGIGKGPAEFDRNATILPVFANYYFVPEQGSLFATAGASIVLNSGTVEGTAARLGGADFGSNPILPTFGIGYENRGDVAGFLFRIAAYGIVSEKIAPYVGFSFGYSF